MITPQGTKCTSANLHAQNIADDMNAAYWLTGISGAEGTILHLSQSAWNQLEKLAALFGVELVDVEPDADEEPGDSA